MDTYYQLTPEQKLELYLKAEPQLTILDSKSIETNLRVLSKKHSNLEDKVNNLMQYIHTNSIEIPDYLR